jgi:hypothetical protein
MSVESTAHVAMGMKCPHQEVSHHTSISITTH